ncbi:LysR family transcriptional regulator [Neorhizobium sp. JUb45]|uniref:LysR family transcriptional regulator n=1 Tax=Neorhizobium sp. JUb45 TaxID=2485113 RepID=UPI001049D793|nr:LysR family transcriptional regulator [Neorhizobium sp. JUb45]TCQ97181.1 DNA-binding transcriptional LysR family regulator [Neorhizobium sp. JUb45]
MSIGNRFDGLTEFAETVRAGSFSAAAAALGITASAVGKSVSRLEARLGTKLLHRTTRSLTLTNEGEAYLAACMNVLDELESAEGTIAVGRSVPVGRVRIDLPGAFGRRHVLPTVLDLSRLHPRLDLSVTFSERLVDIFAEGTDVAVRIGELRDDTGLVARRLGSQRLVICASPSYLAENGVPRDEAELLERDCIGGIRRDQRMSWLMKSKDGSTFMQEVKGRHEFNDGMAMVDAVLAGCGLSQLPTWLVGEHLRSGALVPVLEQHAGAEMPIHVVWPQSRYVKPKLRVLIDALVQVARLDNSGFHP